MDYFSDLINKYFFYPKKKQDYYFSKLFNSIHSIDDLCDFASSLYCVNVEWIKKERLIRDLWSYKERDKNENFYII